MNEMYILFVTFHSLWSGKYVLYSSSVGKVLLIVSRILLCVILAVVSYICLIASKILWCTFDGLITRFCFSGRIPRVHFMVKEVLSIVVVVVCSMRWLQVLFLSLPSCTSCLLSLLILSFFPLLT